jgi:sulfur-carrier protein
MFGHVTIEYFAWVRERIGKSSETIALSAGDVNISALLDRLQNYDSAYADGLAERDKLRFAVNQSFVPDTWLIANGDTLAIFPPVTGG